MVTVEVDLKPEHNIWLTKWNMMVSVEFCLWLSFSNRFRVLKSHLQYVQQGLV